ncbi:DUF4349 domain-containing protein [Undibacterium sp. Ji49W]|uniref:DUF4349 domain-containing protein n=1 Tax=Undibacterium sp. Ji49W TaxID=3413040 RepID=UPI003BF1B010
MRVTFLAILMCLSLLACGKKEGSAGGGNAAEAGRTDGSNKTLAYAHFLELEVDEQKIGPMHAAAQQFCLNLQAEQCVILEAKLDTGRYASARLKFRANPAGIQKLLANLNKQGDVIHQSVTAEDLAAPIQDNQKKLAMLNDYRTRLEALRSRANADIDALIKTNKELASVQEQIESLSGKREQLMQRVNTELLSVTLTPDNSHSFSQPVRQALSGFAGNLAQGVAAAITGIAYLLPWSIVLFFCAWVVRWLWRRKKATAPKP